MTRRYIWACVAVLVIGGVVFLSVKITAGDNAKPLPRGGWTVAFHAYRMSGFNDLPVKVVGVGSAGALGLQVAHVSVSKAEHIVTAVKILWYVSQKGKPAILAKGETPLLELPGNTGAQPIFDVNVPNATLDNVMRPAMENGGLHGDYDVQVVVAEVRYLGGTFWKLPEASSIVIVPLVPIKRNHAVLDECPHQTCRLAADLFSYQCAAADQEGCENFGARCDDWICGAYIQ